MKSPIWFLTSNTPPVKCIESWLEKKFKPIPRNYTAFVKKYRNYFLLSDSETDGKGKMNKNLKYYRIKGWFTMR